MGAVGIIGGSGLDDPEILGRPEDVEVATPFGLPSSPLRRGMIGGTPVYLLARHGREHTIPPTQVNYRANIYALKEAGCTQVLATTAVGSLREEIARGDLVVLDQFIDFTRHRKVSFFEEFAAGEMKHTPMADPFSEPLRRDYGAEDVGYDEFGVADALLSEIAGLRPLTLLVQPHPRDDREEWGTWLSDRHGATARLTDASTEDLLVSCDGALGMTTMVLFAAALLGVPVLSLQPGRRRQLNPRLDAVKGLHRVTDYADIGPALARFLGVLGEPAPIDHGLSDVTENADQRLLAAIEKELPAGCRQPQGAAST